VKPNVTKQQKPASEAEKEKTVASSPLTTTEVKHEQPTNAAKSVLFYLF